ncbi:MAG TPA: response regulator [Bryobacteraceae bacterium]|nr:response regulator [Bryobacteraceae bacterium]
MQTTGDRPIVLLVDDEEMVITSVRAYLALEADFRIEGFTDPEQAAAFVKDQRYDVIVSDYLMPKMTGIQLLRRAKEAAPEASRILLTGHADKQSAIDAINDVALFQYIEKPWDNTQLLLAIQGGIERARLLRDLRDKITELAAANDSLKDVQRRLIKAFL